MKRPLILIACLCGLFALTGCPSGGSSNSGGSSDDGTQEPAAAPKDETPAAPAKPFVQSELRGPWKHAKVGDFAVYEEGSGDKMKTYRYEITKIEGAQVSVTRQELKDGNPVGEAGETAFDMQADDEKYKKPEEYDALTEEPKEQEHTLAGGKTLTVVVMKRKGAGSTTETWLADAEVRPFHGQSVVRSVRDGTKNLDLVDYGSK
ncbi:MAG: hypothetical protein R3F62_20300 [Planctomycetota bacterium]